MAGEHLALLPIAFLIRYEIDDIERSSSPKKLCSYTGIVLLAKTQKLIFTECLII